MRIKVAPPKPRFSLLPGLGYAIGPANGRLNHFLVQLGFGAALLQRWITESSPGRLSRVYGLALYAHLGMDLGVPLTDRAAATHLAFPLRVQQSFAFGRHGVALMASIGPRWDLTPMEVGMQVTVGLGYAVILPPGLVPLVLEATHQRWGVFDEPVWGLRIMVGWPLTY